MLNFLIQFLDDLEYWSMKVLIIIGIAFWIVMAILLVNSLITEDPIVGETHHGIIIRESDLEMEDE